jgi:hypothetical protein
MDHFWQKIDGYFTFPQYYAWVAGQMVGRKEPRLVEVGAYTGQSAAFLGVELINRGVNAKLDLVDKFTDGGTALEVLARLLPIERVLGATHTNLSWDAAGHYDDGSLDFVFIDAGHRFEEVSRDIDAWLPKVKRGGGILGGHDYCAWPALDFGVMRAVNERFNRFEVWPGINNGGDAQMQGHYWPCWSVML